MKSPQTGNDNKQTESRRTGRWPRRPLLKAIGAGAALPLVSGLGAAGGSEDDEHDDGHHKDIRRPRDCPTLSYIDSTFGLPVLGSGMLDEEVSDLSTPDYTVEMQIAPAEIRPKDSEPPLDFFFEPVGLHVQPGEIVNFVGVTPEHTATAYHPQQGRQQRVPDGVPPFSSPVVAAGGSWMYAFLEEGVYDILCAPHEVFGMVMRVVVGDKTDPTRGETDLVELRPPEGFAAAVFNAPEPDPENIVEEGSVSWSNLTVGPPEE